MKNKKNRLLLFFLPILLIIFSFSFASANYGLDDTINAGSKASSKVNLKKAFSVTAVGSDSGSFISTRLGSIVGTILSFVGVLFMVLIIYGGILWMTARGNEQQVEKAKNLITQAIIGLIIVLAAYAITAFIGNQLTDVGGSSPGGTTGGTTGGTVGGETP